MVLHVLACALASMHSRHDGEAEKRGALDFDGYDESYAGMDEYSLLPDQHQSTCVHTYADTPEQRAMMDAGTVGERVPESTLNAGEERKWWSYLNQDVEYEQESGLNIDTAETIEIPPAENHAEVVDLTGSSTKQSVPPKYMLATGQPKRTILRPKKEPVDEPNQHVAGPPAAETTMPPWRQVPIVQRPMPGSSLKRTRIPILRTRLASWTHRYATGLYSNAAATTEQALTDILASRGGLALAVRALQLAHAHPNRAHYDTLVKRLAPYGSWMVRIYAAAVVLAVQRDNLGAARRLLAWSHGIPELRTAVVDAAVVIVPIRTHLALLLKLLGVVKEVGGDLTRACSMAIAESGFASDDE